MSCFQKILTQFEGVISIIKVHLIKESTKKIKKPEEKKTNRSLTK